MGTTLACGQFRRGEMNNLNQILAGNTIKVDSLDLFFQTSDVEIRGLTIPGSQVIETWKQLREIVNETGYWPILIGDSDSKDALLENLEVWEDEETSTIIDRGMALDVEAWLENRKSKDLEYYTPPRGSWPEEILLKDTFFVYVDFLSGQPHKEMYLALIPTVKGWHTPAFLKFGGWNDCPPPEIHVAIFAKWEQEYGAEVLAITGDTIEFSVSRPPQSRDDALRLAQEHFLYCTDIVYQGTETLERLAATVQNNHAWFFWWD
jgi:hypothetical protein